MKTLKNILNVAMSNIVGFGTSFIVGFILPGILTVAQYGSYRQYTLYLSFTYLFHLGFADGIYIKYGGKELNELDHNVIRDEHNFANFFPVHHVHRNVPNISYYKRSGTDSFLNRYLLFKCNDLPIKFFTSSWSI